ncbi:pre-60S ribosomal particles component [Oleoguttula sp. CCFEE 5521]
MAQISAKRRREDGDVRPKKKKVRKIKKQVDYHSSSDDDEDVPEGVPTARRVPPPKPSGINAEPLGERVKSQGFDVDVDVGVEVEVKTNADAPKPILKRAVVTSAPVKESVAEDDEDDIADVEMDETERNTVLNMAPAEASEDEAEEPAHTLPDTLDNDTDDASEDDDNTDGVPLDLAADSSEDDLDIDDDEFSDNTDAESSTSLTSSAAAREKKKRNDSTAFSTSISKILDTKLTTSKRADPVLSRSKSAAEANRSIADSKLETKARAQIRGEKRHLMNKGRVEDVLGLETEGVDTGKVMEEEKRLKKTAQRGVVKLFNAVRAAQVKAEGAMAQARQEGVVGMGKREERVNEMSKQGFLDLISGGGKEAAVA